MVRYLIALLFSFLTIASFADEQEPPRDDLFLSTPEQVATLTSEPSYLVGGLINPLSGQPALRQTDLVVKGAQPIVLSRTYLPPYTPSSFPHHKHYQEEHNKRYLYNHLREHYKGWQFYPHLRLELNPSSMEVRLAEPSGMTLDFRISGSKTSLASLPYAISNLAGDLPSGKYDPRNTRISYEENGNQIVVYAVDGTTRIYRYKGHATWTSYLYLLDKEILPHGKVLKYHYNEAKQLKCIESLDPKERHVYASLQISGTPREGSCHFRSSSGLTVDYKYQKRPVEWKLKEKVHGRKHKEKYKVFFPPILTSVSSPSYRNESLDYCERFLLSAYSGKEDIFTTSHADCGGENPHYRVHKLQLPVGLNDGFQPVYEMSYHPPVAGKTEGSTIVKNSDGTSIVYHFSKNLLTTLIQYFGQEGELKKEKVFSWDEKNWLKALEMRDGQKNTLYRKTYEYDPFGNPLLEVFTGNLTGEGTQETFTTKRTFSEDGKNLLLREETEEGKVICFSYLPNTNLVTSKLVKEGEHILLREFSIYDDCNNLVQTISDDGASEDRNNLSQVTQRILKTYTLRQSEPFLHMPESIEETYWEHGTEKPLKKSYFVYDEHGHVAQEKVYDSEGRHAYTLYKTYNERGDVLSETNRLGQQATYTYDTRGRSKTATNFSNRIQKTFYHDTKGRLRELKEKGDDGVVHVVSSDYDFHDRQIQKKDPFSNSTQYTYDPLVSEVIKTDFPFIVSIEGRAVAVTTAASYDPFGRKITQTDANGHVTTYRYNTYGSAVDIHYPDGSKETFRYAKNGQLSCHTDLDGLTTYYKRDVLGRVLAKTYISVDGATLAQETFTYNGFHLLTETDKEGNLKQYSYDGAGRKIREECCGHITDFSYDPLGYLASTCQHNQDNTLLIHYKRDLEGKLIEEYKTDNAECILYRIHYSYDSDGNRKTITRYINGKEAIDTFIYDSFRRLVEERDASGCVTKTLYDENHTNVIGQKVLQIVETDPRDITRMVTKDALSRTVKRETLNRQKTTLSSQEMIQDPQGNLLYQRDHVYENGHFLNTQTIKYTYTSDHRIASLTRAFGTKEERTTTYTYGPSGRVATKTLPDGVTLNYSYHPFGFMSRVDSSDGTIHHAFEYDLLGHLRCASDENQNIAISRKIDPFGNVLQEVFPYGLEIQKDYDDLNRLVSLRMGSQGEVRYTYDPLFLRGVTRTSSAGKELYHHTYEEYDEAGYLVLEQLIGHLGPITHMTDARGQAEFIASPYFSQQCKYDAVGNLISNMIDRKEHLYSYDGISQLSSEKGPCPSCIYAHDSLYNRTQKNGIEHQINELNELISSEDGPCAYDLNGNQILRQTPSETFRLTYDPLHRLIEAVSEKQKINFVYDPLGRRLRKIVFARADYGWKETSREHYLYHGQNEIGAFVSPNQPTNLRVLGLATDKNSPTTVGIEAEGQVVAPIIDVQGNIRRLIDVDSKTMTSDYSFTAFGEERQPPTNPTLFNPWRFASKRFDPELGLIYFGKRYYDPRLGRWLTIDPAGFIDSTNPYQYVFNNPFRYRDPDGQFIIALPLLALTWKVVAVAAVTAYVAYELENRHDHSNSAFARSFNAAVHQVIQNIGGVSQYAVNQLSMGKKQIDTRLPSDPDELLNDPNWEETSHPDAKAKGHRTFENKETGEQLRHDAGKLGTTGHRAQDHWHRHNPDSTGEGDKYLDAEGNPIPDGHPDSHLYPRLRS